MVRTVLRVGEKSWALLLGSSTELPMVPQMEKWRELEMAIRSASYSDFRSEYEKAD